MPPRLPSLPERIALRGITDPRMALFAGDPNFQAPAPAEPRAPFADRVASLLAPTPAYAGILSPEERRQIGRRGLLDFGLNLLQAGGRSPMQRGTLANLGASLQNLDIPGAVQSAIRMRAVVDELNQRSRAREALKEISARHPAMPGEDREQKFNRLTDIVTEAAGVPGMEDWVGKMSNVLAQLRPQQPKLVTRTAMVDANGKVTLNGGTPAVVTFDQMTGDQVGRASAGTPPVPPSLVYDENGNPVLVGRPRGNEPSTVQPINGPRAFRPELLTPSPQEMDAANWAPGVIQGFTNFRDVWQNNPSAVREAIPFLQGLDVATDAPGLGKLISGIGRAAAQQGLSKEAQDAAVAFIRWTASRVFASGGKQLTRNEITAAIGQYLPSINEPDEVSGERLKAMAQDAMQVLLSTGRAYPRFKGNLTAAGAPDLGDFDPYQQRFTNSATFEDLLRPKSGTGSDRWENHLPKGLRPQ